MQVIGIGRRKKRRLSHHIFFCWPCLLALCFRSFSFYTMQEEKTPTTLVDKLAQSPYPIWSLSALSKRLCINSDMNEKLKKTNQLTDVAVESMCEFTILCQKDTRHAIHVPNHGIHCHFCRCRVNTAIIVSMFYQSTQMDASYVTHAGDAENGAGIATGEFGPMNEPSISTNTRSHEYS